MGGKERFVDLTSSPELVKCSEGFVPDNTKANTSWCIKTFQAWSDWRSTAKPEDPVPEDILGCVDAELLNKWLSYFVIEARRRDGAKYPCNTMNMLLSGLKRHMVKLNPNIPNFLNESVMARIAWYQRYYCKAAKGLVHL